MATLTLSDASGALTTTGVALNGLSDLTAHFSSDLYTAFYISYVLDGTRLIYTSYAGGASSYHLGLVSLSEGEHTLTVTTLRYALNHYPNQQIDTATITFTVKDYATPAISAFSVQRCDVSGNVKGTGTYAKYTLTAAIDPVTVGGVNKNVPLIKLRYKIKGTSVWTDIPLSTTDFTWGVSGVIIAGLSILASNSYDFGVYVSDLWKFAQAEVMVPRDVRPFNAQMISDLLSVCIGSLADEAGKFKCVLASKFTDVVSFLGTVSFAETVTLTKAPVFTDKPNSRKALGVPTVASGVVNVSVGSDAITTVAVTFPTGLFSAAPNVVAILNYAMGYSATAQILVAVNNITTNGCDLLLMRRGGMIIVDVQWIASQMPV